MIAGIKNFFKRADIVLLVLCIITNIYGLILIYSATRFNATYHALPRQQAIAMVLGVVAILSSTFSLVVGILGVKWCNRPDKAGVLFVLGIVLIVLAALSLLSSFSSDSSTSVVSSVLGLVLPVLYTLGAWQNKQSLQ